jgi:FAD:protein FMN transferase
MWKMSIDLTKRAPSARPLIRQTLNGSTMGTRYSAVFHMTPGTDMTELAAALFAAVDRVDQQMSTWKPASDLNRLNAAPVGAWVDIPRELMQVLAASLQVARDSNGAFDIGVGDLVSRWGFGPPIGRLDRTGRQHQRAVVRPALSQILDLQPGEGRVRKSAPVQLDLSGIAKGFAVDKMARVMTEFRIPSWLVGIDGEMRAKGVKPDGAMWAVAHERPDRTVREAMGVLEVQDMAVATSGNYRHVIEVDDKLLSHTIDPRTARPLDNDVASVTVLAPTCMMADAWATAFMVMGADRACDVARARGLDAICVLQDGSVRSTL